MDDEAIQKDGANARAANRSMFDNPYLKQEALPASTGEAPEEWSRKERLWQLGWQMEDAIRS